MDTDAGAPVLRSRFTGVLSLPTPLALVVARGLPADERLALALVDKSHHEFVHSTAELWTEVSLKDVPRASSGLLRAISKAAGAGVIQTLVLDNAVWSQGWFEENDSPVAIEAVHEVLLRHSASLRHLSVRLDSPAARDARTLSAGAVVGFRAAAGGLTRLDVDLKCTPPELEPLLRDGVVAVRRLVLHAYIDSKPAKLAPVLALAFGRGTVTELEFRGPLSFDDVALDVLARELASGRITSLTMSGSGGVDTFPDACVASLAAAVRASRLESISLGDCSHAQRELLRALFDHPVLERVSLTNVGEETCRYRQNDRFPRGVSMLMSANAPRLAALTVDWRSCQILGVGSLVDALRRNTHLQSLTLVAPGDGVATQVKRAQVQPAHRHSLRGRASGTLPAAMGWQPCCVS